ncbi:MAG: rRNA pseudouridine synthase [Chloroflexi bacterium]|nr:rRNA pseudouridine synthase [Chloroflexota bacterium]
MSLQRLQKVLAAAGVASRRHCEALIQAGRVAVDGQVVTQLGARVDPQADTITVDGRPLAQTFEHVYLLLHKPRGYVTTAADERDRPTVMDLLPPLTPRVFPVGRLDRDSEGLLLLTNDGDLTNRLTHPRYGIQREYRVLLADAPDPAGLQRLRGGGPVAGRRVTPVSVVLEGGGRPGAFRSGCWLRMVLAEGRKQEVRELCLAAGHAVRRPIRVCFGPVRLGRLPRGKVRPLTGDEVAALRAAAE